MVDASTVQKMFRSLPETEEGMSYGTPSFKVKGKFMARFREDLDTLVLKLNFELAAELMAQRPEAYFTTPHYDGYPSVLVRIDQVSEAELRPLVEAAWRFSAPKRLLAQHPEIADG